MEYEEKINYGLAVMILIGCVSAFVFLSSGDSDGRNGVDQRNHKRDRIECESVGGFLGAGGWTQDDGYSICHDVDSLIVLNGPREEYNE